MRVAELKGLRSLRALNAFHALLLGLKMLPAHVSESYEDFYARVEELPASEQEKLIREAALFVELQKDEVEAMLSFCLDANGVPFSSANIKNLGPGEIVDGIVAVALEIAKIRVTMVTEAQKKN